MEESETLAETEAGGGEAQPKPEPAMSRKEKRKLMKKMKRKQTRKELALKERDEEEEEEDPEELIRMEEEEARRSESVRILFEERERAWIEAMEIRKKELLEREEEERRIKALEEEQQIENANDDGDDGYEYVSVGPPEVIWTEKEVTVKKNIVKVLKRIKDQQSVKEDSDRPTSNPLPPQSEAFDYYKNASLSAQQLIEAVAEQVPNFGTEQDKDHCPFHLKTGACRFGNRCSRVHFYPDKSSTLLIKNMYNGPGLTWEQDEGLEAINLFWGYWSCISDMNSHSSECWRQLEEYTDEEIERHYEEFYEDVHTEFLKFGEIINFKVCINGASHLRGNVYVQYSALESAVVSHQFMNARYFAGKQISCDFINVTKWKVAICGEYVKSRYKTCSRGTACNFIHCFRNPGGDYEWADSDRPPPKYWVEKMVALFGYSDAYKKTMMEDSSGRRGNSSKMSTTDSLRYVVQRSISRDRSNSSFSGSGRRYDKGNYASKGTDDHRPSGEEYVYLKDCNHNKNRKYYNESDEELLDSDGNTDRDIYRSHKKKRSRRENRCHRNRTYETESDGESLDLDRNMDRDVYRSHKKKRSRRKNRDHKNRTLETESDGELLVSDGNMDRCVYWSCRKERSKQENRNHNRKFETESDGHLLERGPNLVTEHDGTRESSSQQRKAGVRHHYGDCEKEAHEAGEDWSTREGDRQSYHDSRRSSRHKRKEGHTDLHKDRKSKAHDSERVVRQQ